MSATGVEKKRLTRQGSRGFTLIEVVVIVAIIGILAAILMPNLVTTDMNLSPAHRTAWDAEVMVQQAMVYASDNGVYPTSIKMLVEGEVVYCACTDKDLWGNDYVLSPVLTEGRTPRKGDNVYIYSRGWEGTGVYPQPFTSDTGLYGSIGYSSLHGPWGIPRNESSQERYMHIAIVCFALILVYIFIVLLARVWVRRPWIGSAAIGYMAFFAIAWPRSHSKLLDWGLLMGLVFWLLLLLLLAPRRKADSEGQLSRG